MLDSIRKGMGNTNAGSPVGSQTQKKRGKISRSQKGGKKTPRLPKWSPGDRKSVREWWETKQKRNGNKWDSECWASCEAAPSGLVRKPWKNGIPNAGQITRLRPVGWWENREKTEIRMWSNSRSCIAFEHNTLFVENIIQKPSFNPTKIHRIPRNLCSGTNQNLAGS